MCEEEKGLLGKIRKNEGIKPIAVMLTLLGAKVDRRMASSRLLNVYRTLFLMLAA